MPESGRVLVYDDDHYYMGGVLAELLAKRGLRVTLVTPANLVSEWSVNTLEQRRIQAGLIRLNVEIITAHGLSAIASDAATLDCAFTGKTRDIGCDAVVLVTSRLPNDALWRELKARESEWEPAGIRRIERIGNACSPAPIAWATYARSPLRPGDRYRTTGGHPALPPRNHGTCPDPRRPLSDTRFDTANLHADASTHRSKPTGLTSPTLPDEGTGAGQPQTSSRCKASATFRTISPCLELPLGQFASRAARREPCPKTRVGLCRTSAAPANCLSHNSSRQMSDHTVGKHAADVFSRLIVAPKPSRHDRAALPRPKAPSWFCPMPLTSRRQPLRGNKGT